MEKFYCREEELRKLNARYENEEFECLIIYGRRRVGKTALINKFCADKPTIFFSALNTTGKENLKALSKAIMSYEKPDAVVAPEFKSYDDALAEITELAREQRLVFVIDEYPYLAKAKPAISAMLQHLIDHQWSQGKLYLILCGSSSWKIRCWGRKVRYMAEEQVSLKLSRWIIKRPPYSILS